ncbi:MAG: hypothetical protein Q8O95_03545 [bacterium]|nr:hypothetical protein [bacterium]
METEEDPVLPETIVIPEEEHISPEAIVAPEPVILPETTATPEIKTDPSITNLKRSAPTKSTAIKATTQSKTKNKTVEYQSRLEKWLPNLKKHLRREH